MEIGSCRFGCSIFRNCGGDSFSGLLDGVVAVVIHLVSVGSSNLQADRFYQATGSMLSIATIQRWKMVMQLHRELYRIRNIAGDGETIERTCFRLPA